MSDKNWFDALQSQIRAFVDGKAKDYARMVEETGHVSDEVWQGLRDANLLNLAAPRDYGGQGLSFTEYLLCLEILAEMHGSLRVIVHVANGLWRSMDAKATPEQRVRFVKPFVTGEAFTTFTLTEPNSGSGADLKTTARPDGDSYLLNGEKWMIIFSDVADYFLLFCRLEGTTGAEGTLALMVPRASPGLEIEEMAPAMGIRGTHHAHLRLTNCRVPISNRLGAEGDGLEVAFSGFLDPSRIAICMTCVGLANRALALAADHAKSRITFGKALAKRQTIQMWLAEMATDIAAAKQLCLHAADMFESGEPATVQASMAKLFGTDMLQRVTDKALQIHGGIGYFQSSEIERIYRDARMQRFEEGTAEIQKMVIARHVLLRS